MKRKILRQGLISLLLVVIMVMSGVSVLATSPYVDSESGEIIIGATDEDTVEGCAVDKGSFMGFNGEPGDEGSASYSFTTSTSGKYKVSIDHWSGSGGVTYQVSVRIDDEEGQIVTATTTAGAKNLPVAALDVDAGDHTLTITVKLVTGNWPRIDRIRLMPMKFSDYEIDASSEIMFSSTSYVETSITNPDVCYPTVENINPDYSLPLGCWSYNSGDTITLDIEIPEDAVYEMSLYAGVTGEIGDTLNVKITEGQTVLFSEASIAKSTTNNLRYADRGVAGQLELTQGTHRITFEDKSGSGFFFSVGVKKVGGSLQAVVAGCGETVINEGTILPRGTDNLTVLFNLPVSQNSLSGITLSDSNGREILLNNVADDNKVKVQLKEMLADDTNYTLTVANVSPMYGTDMEDTKTYTFTTSGPDSGNGSVECMESSALYEDIYIKLVTKSSVGEPIKGRKVTVTRTSPTKDEQVTVATDILSGDSGVVEISDEITTDVYGNYTYTVTCEYGSSLEVVLNYITESEEKRILGTIPEKTENAEVDNAAIESFFDTNATTLGITAVPDGVDKMKVYAHFIGDTIETGNEFRTKYNTVIYAETLYQAESTDTVNDVLSDETAVELLGLNSVKFSVVLEKSGNKLSADILNLAPSSDLDEMKLGLINAVENCFMEICGKADVLIETVSISEYEEKLIEIPIKLTEDVTEVVSCEITVWSDNLTFDEAETVVEEVNGSTAEYKWVENKLNIKVIFDRKSNIADLVKVFLKSNETKGNYNVKVDGNITYDVNLDKDADFDVEEDIPVIGGIVDGAEFPVTILKSNKNTSSSSGVSTIRPGASAPSRKDDVNTPIVPVEPIEPDEPVKETYKFIDIENVSWAKESIETLLEKGIVSESEDKKFNPDNNIKRSEFLKLVLEALKLNDDKAIGTFKDVNQNAWYYTYVASAQKLGIITGDTEGNFNADSFITRQDMSVIIARALKAAGVDLEKSNNAAFADDAQIADYAKEAIYGLKDLGIINGVGENNFAPTGNATRAQAAKMICAMIKVVE